MTADETLHINIIKILVTMSLACAICAAHIQASLRDFQHYQGCAVADEAKAQRLIEVIARELGE